MEFIIILLIVIFVVLYRKSNGESVYKFVSTSIGDIYDKYAPYSFKNIRERCKEMGLEYTPRQYTVQVIVFASLAFIISYLYFYNIVISFLYVVAVVSIIPYLAYLRCKRLYSEFIFEQVQVYVTNTIMEFQTTQSFVKALEGVYNSGVLEEPLKTDIKVMIDLAYHNGDVMESITYMNSKYDFYMTRNMHQLFLQVTREGAHDTIQVLDNMLLDVDQLVEGVYQDRMNRQAFHKSFITYGLMLYLMVMLIQWLIGKETYISLVNSNIIMQIGLHIVILFNSYFLLSGEKYYNENVGAE
ncbi:MAG: hypothetical protein IJ068_01175 [Bacilli bacterium]|nr:hypothetical protein [Bacilli bacterium]